MRDNDPIDLRHLTNRDLDLFADIDRSEHVDLTYSLVDNELISMSVDIEVPAWDATGSGDHSVANIMEFCAPLLSGGATFVATSAEMALHCGISTSQRTERPR